MHKAQRPTSNTNLSGSQTTWRPTLKFRTWHTILRNDNKKRSKPLRSTQAPSSEASLYQDTTRDQSVGLLNGGLDSVNVYVRKKEKEMKRNTQKMYHQRDWLAINVSSHFFFGWPRVSPLAQTTEYPQLAPTQWPRVSPLAQPRSLWP